MKTHLILGGPGAGKTHRLLETIEKEINRGVRSREIAFVSFTRRAALEARDRAKKRFELSDASLPFFRTLHSLCYKQLGTSSMSVLRREDLKTIGESLGVEISGQMESDGTESMSIGNRMMFLDNLARSTFHTLEEVWRDDLDSEIEWYQLLRFSETLREYKNVRRKIDFTDMLTDFLKMKESVEVRIAIVDEAQDLTPVQWRVVELAFRDCDRLYLAGDDDQAIYSWSGADIDHFLELKVDEREVLSISHRVPRKILDLAQKITDRIEHRYSKPWRPRYSEGEVHLCNSFEEIDLSEGSWYLLARNRCFLSIMEEECIRRGVLYTTRRGSSVDADDVRAIRLYEKARKGAFLEDSEAALILNRIGRKMPLEEGRSYGVKELTVSSTPKIWHDEFSGIPLHRRAYYLTAMRQGERLTATPRIHIDTIHSVKGGESDNVLLMVDQTARTEEGARRQPDDESRVFYVGATRARRRLYIMAPQTFRYYAL